MATSPAFDSVCNGLGQHTPLDRMQCRGTLRLVLKEAGLDPANVQPREMAVVVQRVLPSALESRGVAGAKDLCERLALGPAGLADAPQVDSPDAIFRRLAG